MDPTCGLVDGLVGKFRDLVVDLTWEQLLYFFCYDRNIDQLDGQHKELTLERSSVQHRINEAKNNVEKIEEKVLRWLGEVDELSEQVQKFHEEESQAKIECNLWLRYILSKRAKEMTEEVAKLYAKRNFDTISYRVPLLSVVELTNREGSERIASRIPIMNQILEELRNPGVNMIGLCGLGGVGKTTIAKELEKNQKIFEKVIFATVSQELNIRKIQGEIAEKLTGKQLSENNTDVRASRLCERLKQEKNMLLILDNLWEELDLGKVGNPLSSVEGCKILLTSRDKALLSDRMKCQKIVEVGVLSEDEALELFKKIAELPTDSSSPELISIAIDIVRKCGGLPLQIATVAKALRNKDINEWKDARVRLNNPFRRNKTLTREVDPILKLSYDFLSSSEYKQIFLLSATLSHDPSIEDLIMYSMWLDILDGIENIEDARVGVSAIVRKLKSLNLFVDSISSHHVRIHDVYRDVALPIASNELHVFIRRRLKEWPDENMLRGCKRICLQESDISDLPEELYCPILEFFMLNSTKQDLNIPSMFFKSSKELKVLAFTNVHFSSLLSLIFLHKLKTLCLHSCLLEDIAEIRSLKNLKVLSLAYSNIQRLPIELAELTSLQMLNVSHCYYLEVIPQKLLSNLKKLEVLYLGNSFHQWKEEGSSEANENASLDELTDLPLSSLDIHIPNISMLPENLFLGMNLKRYKISIGKHRKWQDNYETSKILKLQLPISIHLKGGVQELSEGVEDLYLLGSNVLETVLHNHDGRGFPRLRHLQIKSNDDITYDVFNSLVYEDAANKSFESIFDKEVLLPKLETLKLLDLNDLIPLIWDGQISHYSFLAKLVPLHVLKYLNNLEEVEVKFCDMLEIVFDFEDLNYDKEMELSTVVVPLKRLKLWRLPKMKNVWSNHCQGNVSFQSLRRVDVKYCESLTSIFPASIAKGMLNNLEELRITNCDIDVIVAKDQVSESVAVVFQFPRLTSLELDSLPQLTNFYPQRHTLECPHLQRLSIENCDELEIFEKEISRSLEIHEEESPLNSKYPLFSHDKSIPNLEELILWGKHAEMMGSGQFLMYQFLKVKLLDLHRKKATTISYRSLLESFPNLVELELWGDFMDPFGGDDVATHAAPFSQLSIYKISNIISLGQSLVVCSQNLTHLHVGLGDELTSLMTLSTARSLVHLTHLSIHSCSEIEEIISKQEGENDEDRGIFFSKLEFLELSNLPRLKRFCGHNYTFRLLLLECVTITDCPQLTMFCSGAIHTPRLESIQLEYQEIWNTNLNKTLFYRQFDESSGELLIDENYASTVRNDQFPLDRCPEVEILRVEGFVEEGETFPYTFLERFPQLEQLHVEDSAFEEIFPSQNQIVDFKELPNLDQLNSIWNNDSKLLAIQNQEIIDVENCSNLIKLAPSSTSFHNLTMLKVSKCHELVYLVTDSIAKSLVNLETLEVKNCKKLEEIVRKETNEDVEGGITFSGLTILKLADLPRLKAEDNKRDFNIEDRATNTGCRIIFRSHFRHNKVLLPKLEILELSNLKFLITLLWDEHLSHNSFSNLKTLTVERCGFVKLLLLLVLNSLNNLEELEIRDCDMLEMVFDFKEMESSSIIVPLKKLKLWNLPKLKNVWSSYHQEEVRLAPSLVSFPYLKHLEVVWCHEITTLMTSSIARSLAHLAHLSICSCDQIEEIISKQEGEDNEVEELLFNKLEILELRVLPRLKRFCGQNYTFKFLLLESVTIKKCAQLTMFCSGAIHTPRLQSIQFDSQEIWDTNLNKTLLPGQR